jgi:hypothetical protein
MNRIAGSYGAGEEIDLSCRIMPAHPGLAGIGGGVKFKITKGSGRITNEAPGMGTATYTAPNKAGEVSITALSGQEQKTLATAGLKVVIPTSLKFVKNSNIHHQQGHAGCGFRGNVFLQPPGVSYQRLQIREGEFKGKATGCFAADNGVVHEASPQPLPIILGNKMDGMDTIHSGPINPPYSPGRFEWHIPWQYRVIGEMEWTTFEYATHIEEIVTTGRVSISKFNEGPFFANVDDPTQDY